MVQIQLGTESDWEDSEEFSFDSEDSDSRSTSDLDPLPPSTDTNPTLRAPRTSTYVSKLPRPLHSDPEWNAYLEDVFDVHRADPRDLAVGPVVLQSEMPLEVGLGLR